MKEETYEPCHIDLSWLKVPADTPKRYLAALREMTCGYQMDYKDILSTTFNETGSEVVRAEGISFSSLCEHHLLPFVGTVIIEYQPSATTNKVVGLSKLSRLVECFARRLQLQERLTGQIADAMYECLSPEYVFVEVTARHGCIECRGVRQASVRVTTRAVRNKITSNE